MKASVVRNQQQRRLSIISKLRQIKDEIEKAEELRWIAYEPELEQYFIQRKKHFEREYEKLYAQLHNQ